MTKRVRDVEDEMDDVTKSKVLGIDTQEEVSAKQPGPEQVNNKPEDNAGSSPL